MGRRESVRGLRTATGGRRGAARGSRGPAPDRTNDRRNGTKVGSHDDHRFLFVHEVDVYPRAGRRTGYLALAVLATIFLFYTYYTQSGVTPNILRSYSMTFEFYVWVVIISNLIGAFGSLLAGITDRLGRSNVVIYGLLIVGLLFDIGIPNAASKWGFLVVISAMGLVEGAVLVATPALVRDFSPQLSRATAMGFGPWARWPAACWSAWWPPTP